MARFGQLTPSGGREWSLHPHLCAIRRVVLPTACVLNHIGCWVRESLTINQHDLLGALLTETGLLVHETSILTAPVSSTTVFQEMQIPFAGQSVSAGAYLVLVTAGPVVEEGVIVLQGQNDTAGLPTFAQDSGLQFYPSVPADISAGIKTDATRQWDIYLDAAEASGSRAALISQLISSGGVLL